MMAYKMIIQTSECLDEQCDVLYNLPTVSWVVESDCINKNVEPPIPCHTKEEYKNCAYINTYQTIKIVEC